MFTFESPFALEQNVYFFTSETKYVGGKCWIEEDGKLQRVDNYDGYVAKETVIQKVKITGIRFTRAGDPIFKILLPSGSTCEALAYALYESEARAKKELTRKHPTLKK